MTRARGGGLWLLVPRWMRRFPIDLAAVVAGVAAANLAVFGPVVSETPLRVLLGLPLATFLPGYALLAALFPDAGASDGAGTGRVPDSQSRHGIDGIERVALAFGLSLAVVPLLVLALAVTPLGIRLVPIAAVVSGFTVAAVGVAARRRWALPADERFQVPVRSWLSAGRASVFDPPSRTDAALNVVLAASVLLALSSVAYAIAVPPDGERYSEFFVLTENESGDLVADGYPTEFEPGESRPVVLGITNNEHRSMNYTVVRTIDRVAFESDDRPTNATDDVPTVTVTERTERERLSASLAPEETWLEEVELAPTTTGRNLRVTMLLYVDEPPARPTVDNAYRSLHLWANVTEAR